MGGRPPWGPGPPAVEPGAAPATPGRPGAARRGAWGRPPWGPGPPPPPPDGYGGHPGLVWGSPRPGMGVSRIKKINKI